MGSSWVTIPQWSKTVSAVLLRPGRGSGRGGVDTPPASPLSDSDGIPVTWIRIDSDMPWHDKVMALGSDPARWAYVKVLCLAKQHNRSSFASATLVDLLGRHGRYTSTLVGVGLLDEYDGKITVHDFDQYQLKASNADRQAQYRAKSNGAVTPELQTGVTEPLPTVQDIHTGHTVPENVISSPDQELPETVMGFRSKAIRPDPEGGLWKGAGLHDGRHGLACQVCAPQVKP